MIVPEKYSGLDLSSVKPIINRNLIIANKYSYRIYSLPDLKYILDSIIFEKKIRAIYSQNEFVYVGCSNKLYTIKRNVIDIQEYDDKIEKILIFHPIKIITTKHKLYINEKEMHFQGIRGILHIPTYLNKILLYTAQYIKIINIISLNVITTIFQQQISDKEDQVIQLIKETQALDIVAIATTNPSQVILFNILNNSIITRYELGQSIIKDIQFNKSGHIPYMGIVQDKSLTLFNLNSQELIYTFNNQTSIDWALFYQDNSVYIGSKEQNSIQQFTLEEHKIMSPVRSRDGVSQFINQCSFYGQQGEPQINYIATSSQEICYQSIVNSNLTAIKKGIINNFSFSTLRENDWANILTSNRDNQLEFWNINQRKLNIKLNGINIQGRVLGTLVSKCGNYGFIATENKIYKFTMQSGSYLMTYNLDAPYMNMFLDLANIYLIVALQGKLVQLDVVSGDCQEVLPLNSNVTKIVGSLTSQILAASLENNKIIVIDYQTMKIIRSFEGHSSKILDMAMTIDNQHLVSSSLDKKIKIWNLIYGNLVQEITLNKAIISLDISEGQLLGVFLNSRQVAVWASHLNNPQQLAKAKRSVNMVFSSDLSIKSIDHRAALYGFVKLHKIEEETKLASIQVPQQPNEDEYIKFTHLEEGRWVPIQHIDQIRDRNRVKLADADVKMPFFMDFRNADIEKQNLLNEIKDQVKEKTKILKKKKDQFLAEIKSDFEKLVDQEDVKLIELIKTLSPTSYDYELRSILMGKPQNQLRILRIFEESFRNLNDLDLKVTYLLRFLEVAREDMDLSMDEEIKPIMNAIIQLLESQWERLDDQRSYIECVIEYSKTKI